MTPGDTITWEQFEAVEMRVGRIASVDDFPEARVPAWKLEVDFGPELGTRRSSAQITSWGGVRPALAARSVFACRSVACAATRFATSRIGWVDR